MDVKINLWNMSDGKNKSVILFLDDIETHVIDKNYLGRDDFDVKKFDAIMESARQTPNTNEILKLIGYINHKRLPRIFEWCMR